MNLHDIINEARFKYEDVPQPPPVITIQGKTVATSGNFITINGLPKNFKSTVMGFFIYSALSGRPCFDIQVNTDVIQNIGLIDTEQGIYDFSKQMKRVKKMLNINALPVNFHPFTFRKYDPAIILQATEEIIKTEKTSLLFVDNLTELVMNPNDMVEAKNVIQLLKKWTSEYNITIVCLLHLGKTSFNSLGNLGSYADRAAQSAIKVSFDKEQSGILIEPTLMRSDRHFEPILIRYNEETNEYTQGEVEQKESTRKKFVLEDLTVMEHRARLNVIFEESPEAVYSALIERLKIFYGVGTNIAKQKILPYLITEGFVTTNKGLYKLK